MPTENIGSDEHLHKPLFDLLKSIAVTLPARFIFYASALGAFTIMSGNLDTASLPPQIATFINLVGFNAFAHILGQVARGNTDTKILATTIQEALERSGIENALKNEDFQRELARLLREQRHFRYAIKSGQEDVAKQLSEQYRQYTVIWEALRDDIVGLLEAIESKTDTIISILQDVQQHVATRLPATFPFFDIYTPPTFNQEFIGRESIIEKVLRSPMLQRFTIILGISGSGKSALMKQFASRLLARGEQVFWYEFKAELFSLDSILSQLAAYIDAISELSPELSTKIRIAGLSYDDRIRLLTKSLNKQNCYLFFDAYEEANSNPAIESFFLSLKQQLTNRTVFLASQITPQFYTLLDERNGTVQTVPLDGFTQTEIEAFFVKHGVTLASKLAQAFGDDVLPMSLVLSLALLDEDFQEADLLNVVAQVEDDSIETLFDKVYARLSIKERELLTTASCFIFPFQASRLLNAHQALTRVVENLQTVRKLKKRLFLQEVTRDYLVTHDIISRMMLKYTDDRTEILKRLADFLSQPRASSTEDAMEAVILYMQAKEYNSAVDLFVELTDTLVTYYPDLAKTFLEGFSKIEVGRKQGMWLSHSQGRLHQHFRRYKEAEKAFSDMLHIAGEIRDETAAAIALLSLGTLYHDRDFQKAEKYYLQSLAIVKSQNNIDAQSDLYNNLGSLYIDFGKLPEAELMLNNGLQLLEARGLPDTEKLSLWANLGHLHSEQEAWQDADKYTVLVRDIAQKELLPNVEATAEYDLGIYQYLQGNNERALEHYDNALKIAETYHLWRTKEQIHKSMGILYFTIGEHNKAIENYQNLAAISEEVEDYGQLAAVNFDTGSFLAAKGDMERATHYYEKGLILFEHLTEEDEIDAFLENTFSLANGEEQSTQRIIAALKYLKNKLKVHQPTYALAMVYGTLGRIYVSILHKERLGFTCLKEQVRLFSELKRIHDVRGHQLNLASLYQDTGNYSEAIRLTTEIINDENEDISDLKALSYFERASALASLTQYERAEGDYQNAIKLAHLVEKDGFAEDVRLNLSELHRLKNEPQKAILLLQSTLAYTQQHQLNEGEILTLHNLGLAYQEDKQVIEAERCFRRSIELAQKHYMKADEAKALISVGNLYSESANYYEAQQNYERAYKVASKIENLNLIVGSVISIAYVRWKNGSFKEFEPEFDKVLQQTADLDRYDNLFQFFRLAGQIYMSRGEFQAAAQAFSEAIGVVYVLAIQQFMQLVELEQVNFKASNLIDIFEIITVICDTIDETLHKYSVSEVRDFYNQFINYLNEKWDGHIGWILKLITPLDEFLQLLPNQRAILFVSSRWRLEKDGNGVPFEPKTPS